MVPFYILTTIQRVIRVIDRDYFEPLRVRLRVERILKIFRRMLIRVVVNIHLPTNVDKSESVD